mgnify:CR=1 FL=1
MPKIPQYTHQPAQLGRRAGPGDFVGGEGLAAIGQAVGQVGDLSFQIFEQEMESNVARSIVESTKALDDLYLEVQNMDHNEREVAFANGSQKIIDEKRKGLRYPKYQEMFDLEAASVSERRRMNIGQSVRRDRLAVTSGNNRLYIDSQLQEYRLSQGGSKADNDERNLIRENIAATIERSGAGGVWSAYQTATERGRVDSTLARYDMTRLAQDTTSALIDEYGDDRASAFGAAAGLGGELEDKVIQRLDNAYRQMDTNQDEADDALVSGLHPAVMEWPLDDEARLTTWLLEKNLPHGVTNEALGWYRARKAGGAGRGGRGGKNWAVIVDVGSRVNSGEFPTTASFTKAMGDEGLLAELGEEYRKLHDRVGDPNENIRKNKRVSDGLKRFGKMIAQETIYDPVKPEALQQAAAFDSWFWTKLESLAKDEGATSPEDKLALALRMVDAHKDNKFYVGALRAGNPYNDTNVGSFVHDWNDPKNTAPFDPSKVYWDPYEDSAGELQYGPEVPPADEDVLTRLPGETPEELTRRRNRLENDG